MNTKYLLAAIAAIVTLSAHAEVTVKDAWIRGIAPGQRATGAFMLLTSPVDATLVEVASPAAKVNEIHTMAMDNGVMRMRAIPSLSLPAGKTVELKPGGYHLMLMELSGPLHDGASVPLTLTFSDAAGKRTTQTVQATVRPLAGGPPAKH
ncbi:MAG: copper chaperone PCu(A)C [Burkholderiales bacterium]|nr:copper chaperone PCu(A)C [Burkholderiales bacterium]